VLEHERAALVELLIQDQTGPNAPKTRAARAGRLLTIIVNGPAAPARLYGAPIAPPTIGPSHLIVEPPIRYSMQRYTLRIPALISTARRSHSCLLAMLGTEMYPCGLLITITSSHAVIVASSASAKAYLATKLAEARPSRCQQLRWTVACAVANNAGADPWRTLI